MIASIKAGLDILESGLPSRKWLPFPVDDTCALSNNNCMSIDAVTPADIMQDLELLCACVAEGRPIDQAVARRVQERSESLRQQLQQTNVAVDSIREIREET